MIIYNDEFREKVENLKERNSLEGIIISLEKLHELDNETLKRLKKLKETLSKINVMDDSHKKYLAEIVIEEEPEFESNTMIISPVGSGKTTLIRDVLIDKENADSTLMLVSNRFLKESMYESNLEMEEDSVKFKITSSINKKDSVHMMTYHEFGLRIRDNNKFMNDIKLVFCDEIHSLPEYREYNQGNNKNSFPLEHAMKYLFSKQEGKQIFYFTATDFTFNTLKARRPELVSDVKVIDYRNHPDIKKYMELSKSYITHIEQIRPFLKDRIESFNYFKSKGLAFARTIASIKRIEEILIEEGYNPLVLWSDANEDNKLTKKQIKARKELLKTGKIPDEYNFLVMNSALREGWDLKDPGVRLVIMNTTNETDVIQARGRVRKDVDLIVYRTTDELDKLNSIELSNKYIDVPLDVKEKDKMCDELNIKDKYGKVKRWRGVKSMLEESGYELNNSKLTIEGKRVNVTTISIKN